MEVKINGMPKEIADFLKEIETRPMYSKPTAHTHSVPSVSSGIHCHSMPSISSDTHCHSVPSISSDTHCHIVLTPNSDEDEWRNGMKKRKQKKGLLLGAKDTKGYSVRISIKVSDGNANNLIGEDCKDFIIQSLLRAHKRDSLSIF